MRLHGNYFCVRSGICFFAYLRQGGSMNAAIQAMLSRARTGLLASLAFTDKKQDSFDFWQGQIAALMNLSNGTGQKLAAKDALLPYETPAFLAAAAFGLDDDVYRLPRAKILQRLAQAGIQITPDAVANLDVIAAHQFEHGAIPAVDLHNEHAPTRVDIGNGSGLHDEHLVVMGVDIVAEGGAA